MLNFPFITFDLGLRDETSATGHLLQLLGVASPFHRDLRSDGFDLTEIVRREFDRLCAKGGCAAS